MDPRHARRRLQATLWMAVLMAWCCTGAAQSNPTAAHPALPVMQAPPGSQGSPALQTNNLIQNAGFDGTSSLPWMSQTSAPALAEAQIQSGALCNTITHPGAKPWDVQVRQRELALQPGHSYTVRFNIWADHPVSVRAKVGMAGPPYTEYWGQNLSISREPQLFKSQFVMAGRPDPAAEFALHMGGALAGTAMPLRVCIDDIYLTDPQFTAPPAPLQERTAAIRLNQVGYFPRGPKVAAYVSDTAQPVAWQLRHHNQTVATGQTEAVGRDQDSGDTVQRINFSGFGVPGEGYTLVVGNAQSSPFRIADDLYRQLAVDAMNYFYQNRSGIDITLPYARHARWARAAGHATSDKSAVCLKGSGCNYRLDVSGGWYDAGDHGKYVVNGGIAVWTLLNFYERNQVFGDASTLGDGSLTIPESGNGVPDVLDEARWELEFLLKMQAPAGSAQAGMVHHKIHDELWTALGTRPDEAERAQRRFIHPVSTAATLNLAAVAAQAARLWRGIDDAFAKRCLVAAEAAWTAAKANPRVYAATAGNGGGLYDDNHVEDEFFWAAAELFITTARPNYRADMLASPHWRTMTTHIEGVPNAMNWSKTDALGTLSLAIAPSSLSPQERAMQRQKVLDVADSFLPWVDQQAYRVPMGAGSMGKYPWGSNGVIANNLIVLAVANDLRPQPRYVDAVVLGMDYVLGRNGMGQSYVSGYGSKPLQHPHHRFWAQQANSRFPGAPPGALSGGPNSSLQDPYVKALGLAGCSPQKCYVDHIEAWSVNEITINWNAPLAWVAAYLNGLNQGNKSP